MKIISSLLICLWPLLFFAQKVGQLPESRLSQTELEAHLRFLASDELAGRRTGDPGNAIAARYIAEQFRRYGLKALPEAADYLQAVPLQRVQPAASGMITLGEQQFNIGKDFVLFSGDTLDLEAEAVFAGYGWVDPETGQDDYKGLEVKGKIVVVIAGREDIQNPNAAFQAGRQKRDWAEARGALALIEIYQLRFPWEAVARFLNKERIEQVPEKPRSTFSHCWIAKGETDLASTIKEGKNLLHFQHSGVQVQPVYSSNPIGVIAGTDPKLKEEYLLLTAHYDHVGVGKQGGQAFTDEDSIFNGARDNAMGVTALLASAKALGEAPPKRSVIFLAVTGEEMGLLGSQYYAQHPLIPLNKTIVNFNTDGAGYHDTSIVSTVGAERVGLEELFVQGAKAFGLGLAVDPMPEMGLFDRSDNVAFAAKGIPAPSLSPGITAMNDEIQTYYHQAADNPESINFSYLKKYCQAFAYITRLIADLDQRPSWVKGDKYEEAGKKLYGKP